MLLPRTAHAAQGGGWKSAPYLLRGALCAILLISAGPSAAQAQSPQQSMAKASPELENLSIYEGQNVAAIEVAGQPDLDAKRFQSLFVQKAGEPFSADKVDQTIAAIQKAEGSREVRLVVEPESGGVDVLLVVEPAIYFGIFEFTGNKWFSYSRLLQVTNYPPDAAYNMTDIHRAQQNLLNYCHEEGYFEAQVRPEIEVDQPRGIANVTFHMELGRHANFGHVTLHGVTPQEADALRGKLHGIWARLKGSAIRPGKSYHHKTITRAVRLIEGKLADKEKLAANVHFSGAEYHPETNRADIAFEVRPGPRIQVKIEGAHIWSWTKKSLLPVYQGVGVNRELVQEGREALISYFQKKGYFDAQVSSRLDKKNGAYVIVYQIAKEKRHKVAKVAIRGNRKIGSEKLDPLLQVKKGHFFSHGQYSEKLVRASKKNLENYYHSEGFMNVSVNPSVKRQGGNIDVVFQIDEKERDRVHSLKIEGADTLAKSAWAPNGLKLAENGPYAQRLIEDDRKSIVANYLNSGYPNASFRERAHAVSKKDPHDIDVTYQIQEGPRVTIHNVYTLGRKNTLQRVINADIEPLQPDKLFSENHLLSSESRLYDNPGVFDWAEIDARRRITTQRTEDVLVKVHEAPKNRITYGIGFELINRGGNVPSGTVALPNLPPVGLPGEFQTNQKTFWGPRGTVEYTRNNLRGRGESLSFTVFGGRLDQRGAIYYIDPNLFWTDWRSTASISAEHDAENPIFSSNQESVGYQVQRELNRAKNQTLFFRYNYSHTMLTRLEIPELVPSEDRNVRLSTVSTAFIRDTRDNILDAHKGLLESLNLDLTATRLGANIDFAKLTAQAAYYKEIGKGIVWANSVRIGGAPPYADSHVPLSELFFTGGGSTLRGFPLDSAGPQRKVQVCSQTSPTDCSFIQAPTGGRELMLLNSEFRIPLPIMKNLGMAVFYDGGNVFPGVGFHDFGSLYTNNVGLGLRYNTPVGPIRFDLGHNMNPVPGIKSTQYFISIGQAF